MSDLFYFKKKYLIVFLVLFFLSSFSFVNAVNEDVTITAEVIDGSSSPPGGSIGPGEVVKIPKIAVRFSGIAYPYVDIIVSRAGKEQIITRANAFGSFTITLQEKNEGNVLYTLFTKDNLGNDSVLLNYPVVLHKGYLTHVSGIRFPPTLSVDKFKSHSVDFIGIRGYASPAEGIEIIIENKKKKTKKTFTTLSQEDGFYIKSVPITEFTSGEYLVYTRYLNNVNRSKLSKFVIRELNLPNIVIAGKIPGDCNFDSKIDLIDFSIMSFWYKKSKPPLCVDLNKDRIIDLIDFSILVFYWTG